MQIKSFATEIGISLSKGSTDVFLTIFLMIQLCGHRELTEQDTHYSLSTNSLQIAQRALMNDIFYKTKEEK